MFCIWLPSQVSVVRRGRNENIMLHIKSNGYWREENWQKGLAELKAFFDFQKVCFRLKVEVSQIATGPSFERFPFNFLVVMMSFGVSQVSFEQIYSAHSDLFWTDLLYLCKETGSFLVGKTEVYEFCIAGKGLDCLMCRVILCVHRPNIVIASIIRE